MKTQFDIRISNGHVERNATLTVEYKEEAPNLPNFFTVNKQVNIGKRGIFSVHKSDFLFDSNDLSGLDYSIVNLPEGWEAVVDGQNITFTPKTQDL